ncbi:MAG: nitroreductase family protein [Candidatus Aminicenantes bacterium]|jgi:nitroreductase
MDVSEAIASRRAYRSLVPVRITRKLIKDLAASVRLSPSCFNNQPWRFVFVYERGMLEKMREALSGGNKWAYAASLIIAVFSRKQDDCVIISREYYQFDCGLAVGFLVLRAAELGLVAHPIAGYSPKKTREILGIPEDYQVITLIIVGKKTDKIGPLLSKSQAMREKSRPRRRPFREFVFLNSFGEGSRLVI